ncbi:MAG: hypothetical protein ACKVS9_06320 [Phycisphaerae bacterium]
MTNRLVRFRTRRDAQAVESQSGYCRSDCGERIENASARAKFVLVAALLAVAACDESPRPPAPPPTVSSEVRGASIDGRDDRVAEAAPIEPSSETATTTSTDESAPESPEHEVLSAADLAKYMPKAPSTQPIDLSPDDLRLIAGKLTEASEKAAGGELKPVGQPDRDRAGYLGIAWEDLLSFHFELVGLGERLRSGKREDVLPKRLLDLDGKQVSIGGFIMPVVVQGDRCKSFMLVRSRMFCCFGAPLGLTDWVLVELDGGKSIKPVQDMPITVFGTLSVKPESSDGLVLSLLEIRATDTSMDTPK